MNEQFPALLSTVCLGGATLAEQPRHEVGDISRLETSAKYTTQRDKFHKTITHFGEKASGKYSLAIKINPLVHAYTQSMSTLIFS